MTDYVLKSRISTLKDTVETIELIRHEICEESDFFCEKCPVRLNDCCIPNDAVTATNILIRQYAEMHKGVRK